MDLALGSPPPPLKPNSIPLIVWFNLEERGAKSLRSQF